eukprot:GHVS01048268.1.p2 GENE.GHVS01048268.1~~GHVS01048268.1.p2  ORF type:complete len:100 (-),score=4.62 GHVS01048268.1:130-429(-)
MVAVRVFWLQAEQLVFFADSITIRPSPQPRLTHNSVLMCHASCAHVTAACAYAFAYFYCADLIPLKEAIIRSQLEGVDDIWYLHLCAHNATYSMVPTST